MVHPYQSIYLRPSKYVYKASGYLISVMGPLSPYKQHDTSRHPCMLRSELHSVNSILPEGGEIEKATCNPYMMPCSDSTLSTLIMNFNHYAYLFLG